MSAPQPLVESRTVGGFRIHALQAGGQKLDGGAMFGVVPKPLWERRIPADERNRIPLGMRCLLVEHDDGLVLIDSGAGNKENEQFLDIYGIENAGAERSDGARGRARDSSGHGTDDIRIVIDTHLHFDHAGGNTYRDEAGAVRPTFPKARYVVQRGEFDYASHTNERTAASYFPHNFAPVAEAGLFDLVEGEKRDRAGDHACCRRRGTCRFTRGSCSSRRASGPSSSATSCRRRRTCRCPGSWATTSSRW